MPISRVDAKRIVLAKHYMKTFPQGARVCFGIMKGKRAVGVCVFGYSSSTEAKASKLVPGLNRSEILEMQRFWVNDSCGHNTESFVLAKIMKLLKIAGVRVVVTHAGGCKNDCGFVYQASGWMYFGRAKCNDFFLTAGGEYRNIIAAMRFGRVSSKNKTPNQIGRELYGPGEIVDSWRYLYLYPIDKGIRRRLASSEKPYPKESAVYRFQQEWVENGAGEGHPLKGSGSNPDCSTTQRNGEMNG
tara:strand:+ start:11879 stop:12610 length:732 start_codon:yes stop_codon:yes gene_type:complete